VGYGLGVYDPDTGADHAWTWCFDQRTGTGGYDGPPDDNRRGGSVIYAIDSMEPATWTNIAGGLESGIEVLSQDPGHFGRPFAKRYIILLTDGVPNRWPGYPNDHACHEEDLWPPDETTPEEGSDDEAKARDCAIYYANQAKVDENIRIFAPEGMHQAFEDIANTIDLRLVE
jgi:hypothetical protein